MGRISLHVIVDDILRSRATRAGIAAADLLSRSVSDACLPPRGEPRWRTIVRGVHEPVMGKSSEAGSPPHREHPTMPSVEVDDATHLMLRFAARVFGVSESEVVARAVRYFSEQAHDPGPTAFDPWTPVDVYGEYEGHVVRAQYLPATRRLTVTSEPLPGKAFKSPSGAASAVVAALNPGRSGSPQTNGWRFWHLATTHERLEVLR